MTDDYQVVFITNRWMTEGILKTQARRSRDGQYWYGRSFRFYPTSICFATLEEALADVERQREERIADIKEQLERLERYEPEVRDL